VIFQAPEGMNNELRRIAIGIQYDGSPFCGWQSQINQPTIQDHIEAAISHFIGGFKKQHVRLTAAGRTDTGVHALGQVAHFDTYIERPDWSWVRGLNNFLPQSISIQWAKEVPLEFDARFSAFERSYCYFLVTSPVKTPLLHQKAGHYMLPNSKSLRLEEMRKAASYLMGEHDFTSFRSSECQSKTPVKAIYQIDIIQDGPKYFFFLRANAFLHHMVRNIIGGLLHVGLGKQPAQWFDELLKKKNRSLAAPTFSADGLYLCQVAYPNHFEIPQPNFEYAAIPNHYLTQAFGHNNHVLVTP
jgi:tRNA pseudouridine38-40 synthase